jgi:hypothetical protein
MSDYDPYGDARKQPAEEPAPVYDPYGDARRPAPTEGGTTDRPSRQGSRRANQQLEKEPPPPPSRTEQARAAVTVVRTRVAQVVWIVCVVAAVILALGALCVAVKANPDNNLVRWILDTADKLDLGIFERTKDGVYHVSGNTQAAHTKNALVNWGLAALVWLVAGGILAKLIRPKAPSPGRRTS